MGTFNWLSSLFTDFTSQLGLNTNDWTQAILGFILFLPQLPLRVGQLLLDTVMKALGFGDDFTNTMINGAINTVNGFISYITSLPGRLQQELDEMLAKARDFALQIADILSFGGASMVYGWIKNIQKKVGITTVYVTHDQEEALAISDRIAVMNDGVIQQIGTPRFIYQRPANEFVSGFIGLSNFMDADLQGAELRFEGGYSVSMNNLVKNTPEKVHVAVRPEDFIICPADRPGIHARVESSVFLGMSLHYFVTLENGQEAEVVVTNDLKHIIPDGSDISLQVQADKINVFDASSRNTLIDEKE